MTPEQALDAIHAHADPERAKGAKAYHKADRLYLGVANPVLNDLTKSWRHSLNISQRVALADGLWATDIFEARLAAAKLLTQARIKPDDAAWELIASWVPDFDSWAIADHACMAGQKRLVADPARVNDVGAWVKSDKMWTRRAALVITLPWTKPNFPKPEETAVREQVLDWAASYVADRQWFIQKAIAWWIRDLSKHDPLRAQSFLDAHGQDMKPFAAKEAARFLGAR
ncbi:DNA alkylation repair protein [Tateyamaria pelophila]|uniref:DNA alkylation repair protein n=1 Tax=Tateyamaria pelophila TaxID=328415 RepID=UPI001CC075AB|nr:DNA alkylation repair protein [Tateyamaria pelophila]